MVGWLIRFISSSSIWSLRWHVCMCVYVYVCERACTHKWVGICTVYMQMSIFRHKYMHCPEEECKHNTHSFLTIQSESMNPQNLCS